MVSEQPSDSNWCLSVLTTKGCIYIGDSDKKLSSRPQIMWFFLHYFSCFLCNKTASQPMLSSSSILHSILSILYDFFLYSPFLYSQTSLSEEMWAIFFSRFEISKRIQRIYENIYDIWREKSCLQPHAGHQEQNMCGYLGKDNPQLPRSIQYYIS